MGLFGKLRRVTPGVRAPESRGWEEAAGAGVRGSGALAETAYVGRDGASGESVANLYPHDRGVTFVREILPVDTPAPPGRELVPVIGPARPQRHVLAMGGQAVEYADDPALDGHHAEIVGRPFVLGDIHIVWADNPANTQWRTIPPTDAENPSPGGC